MGLIKSNTQRGNENNIYECVCGSHQLIHQGSPRVFSPWEELVLRLLYDFF